MKSITDQNVIQEVLGHLANNPTLLSQTDKFNLSVMILIRDFKNIYLQQLAVYIAKE